MNRSAVLIASLALLSFAGCAEREQTANGIRSDAQPFVGTSRPEPFMAAGWKAGDRASWEQHMKVRTQGGQNEYVKIE
ncbi:MAG: hypothetical protein JWP41_4033 [Ramlibacter sp.]|nr:hypothetical protein [Ramlibacter sp.]